MKRGFWVQKANQKRFFDAFAKKYDINFPQDWGKVNTRQIIKEGGAFLSRYFKGSLYRSLRFVYPGCSIDQNLMKETQWKLEWFTNLKRPSGFWLDKRNQRIFFDELAKKFEITHPSQWSKISPSQIEEEGGSGILSYHRRSVFRTLKSIYSGNDSNCKNLTSQKS